MEKSKYNLKNRYCLITGAGGLLGKEHAIALLEIKSNLVLTDIDTKALYKFRKELVKFYPGSNILINRMDVSNEKSIIKVVKDLKKKRIKLHALINNAAIDSKISKNQKMSNTEKFENISLKNWKNHFDVGLTGAMLCSKHFGKMIIQNKKGGVIINIASDLSVIAPNHEIYKKGIFKPVMYSVIKHGIIGLTKYISTYWNSKKLRCNAISPGPVEDGQPKIFIKKLKKHIPLNRLALKNEYRGAIQFLCSDASEYMTGQNLIIDGGRSVW
tara:strand:+ start:1550 stop:2362 length:813 start_codon:yes stop_codon:yes gene_type:complete